MLTCTLHPSEHIDKIDKLAFYNEKHYFTNNTTSFKQSFVMLIVKLSSTHNHNYVLKPWWSW